MKRILYFLSCMALLLIAAQAQSNTSTVKDYGLQEFAGEYLYSSGFVGAEFKLSGDGQYRYNTFSDGGEPYWLELGSYALRDNVLHFKATKKTLGENGHEYNMLDPEQAAKTIQLLDHRPANDDEIRTEYDMQIIRWGERLYLLEPDKLNLFTAAVNFGVEPRQSTIDRNYLTRGFFVRINDADKIIDGEPLLKAAIGSPLLPEPWNSYLQAAPIRATVTKIESQREQNTYQVNKGSADGIKVGMIFTGENKKTDGDSLLFVISVEKDSARLKSAAIFRATDYIPGNVVTTKKIEN